MLAQVSKATKLPTSIIVATHGFDVPATDLSFIEKTLKNYQLLSFPSATYVVEYSKRLSSRRLTTRW